VKHYLLVLIFFLISSGFQTETGRLTIRLKGVKEGKGKLYISLFGQEDGFPDEPAKAMKTWVIPAESTLDLGSFPPGTYALALLHDLDGNKKMSYSFLGMPTDGYSSSPDGGLRWSKPVFSKAKFFIRQGENRLTLLVHY
jgi:uncharacterized protein (DUF2141 family)